MSGDARLAGADLGRAGVHMADIRCYGEHHPHRCRELHAISRCVGIGGRQRGYRWRSPLGRHCQQESIVEMMVVWVKWMPPRKDHTPKDGGRRGHPRSAVFSKNRASL